MDIQNTNIKDFFDYENAIEVAGAGRKSQYNKAKELLEKMYNNKEKVTISSLAKTLSVSYNTAKNYLYRFLKEELKINIEAKVYNYKR